ncbi:MAG: hypothetical protein HY996_03245 [Micrococcales bacterium]|nr:hypothetical protein [Micrococcales bacterium]
MLAHGALVRVRGLGATLRDESQIPPSDLTRLEVYVTVAVGFALIDPIRAADFQGRALRLALRTGERRRLGRVLAHEAIARAARGPAGLADAEAVLARSRQLSLECRDRYVGAIGEGARGIVLYLAGRFTESRQCMRDLELRYVKSRGADGTFSAWEVETARLFYLFALSKLGSFAELAVRIVQYRLDVGRRGDRYGETSYLRGFNVVWLTKDKPDEAERDLDRATWTAPEVGFHVQHWYELRARIELAQYRGEVRDLLGRHEDAFTRMRRSLLPRVMMVRTEMRWVRARTALATAGVAPPSEQGALVAEARRMARKLERERVPVASAWAALLRGALASRAGDTAGAIAALDRAIEAADALQMSTVAACAHLRRGALFGGADGATETARADAALRREGVVSPERLCEVVAPGYSRGSTS